METKFDEELLIRWHTQFAENQRFREQSFLKILGFLGAVIFSYSYVFVTYGSQETIFYLVSIAAMILISFGAWQIITIAYNFRRDQYVNVKIRLLANIIGKGKPFPDSFNPYNSLYKNNNKKYFDWIPEFLKPYYFIFPVFQVLLLISFVTMVCSPDYKYVCLSICVIIILLLLTIVTLLLPVIYYSKLKNKYREFSD